MSEPGWGFPGAAKKAHYFERDASMSICGRWLWFGTEREPETGARSRDDCAACVKKLPAPEPDGSEGAGRG